MTCLKKWFWFSVFSSMLLPACKNDTDIYKFIHLDGYATSSPLIVHLPETVEQISGIVYYPKDSSIFCIDDNIGELYKFPLYQKKVLQKWPFSRAIDHEELVLQDSTFYVLLSNGTIESIRFNNDGTLVTDKFESTTTTDMREFEAMVYDSTRKLFLLICKDCEDDSSNKTSVYGVDFSTKTMLPEPVFIIDHLEIEKKVGKRISKFKPAGAGIHPITGNIYYVSAINDLLVVTDRNGVVTEASALDKAVFKQPEGIAFKPDGTLLISNEFANMGSATILLYAYKNRA